LAALLQRGRDVGITGKMPCTAALTGVALWGHA